MADYKRMYAVLCGAVDDVIDPLERIPLARPSVCILRTALRKAEDIYINTTPYGEAADQPQVIFLRTDPFPEQE
ncbi:MAG: hypothetical protein ACI3VN_07405 [Candidatus Onthomonas sp.]